MTKKFGADLLPDMDPLFPATLLAVAGYSVIQSLFGVGVLIFGTPTLLLLGYPFEETLSLLLPCSIVINLLQVAPAWREAAVMRRRLLTYLVPFVAPGLLFVLLTHFSNSVKPFIGAMLVITAFFRTTKKPQHWLKKFVVKNQMPAFALTGFIHGATNMGGGFLTILMNALFSDKESVRAHIALGYLMMAGSQILVLGASGNFFLSWQTLILPLLSGLIYLTIGNRIFKISTQGVYQHLMTALIGLFGLILLSF